MVQGFHHLHLFSSHSQYKNFRIRSRSNFYSISYSLIFQINHKNTIFMKLVKTFGTNQIIL